MESELSGDIMHIDLYIKSSMPTACNGLRGVTAALTKTTTTKSGLMYWLTDGHIYPSQLVDWGIIKYTKVIKWRF